MVKKNYSAWHIEPGQFRNSWSDTEKLRFFARYGVLAPSGHNSQPWELSIKNNSLIVSVNPQHHLSADGSGLLSVEPHISVGTFIEVLNMAAKGFGYEVNVSLFPTNKQVAAINIQGRTVAKPDLLHSITTRASNRNPFETTPLPNDVINKITSNDFSGIATTIVTGRDDIDFLAQQTEEAICSIMDNTRYRKELSAWVRTNHTLRYDGMPGFTHGFGNFKSLLSKTAVRHVSKQGPHAKKSGNLIRMSGALIIVRCCDNNKESFVNAGRLYSQLCVLANNAGLATSALGAAVIDTDTREAVKKHFGIKDRPIYILRFGKPKVAARHSPRWPLEKVFTSAAS